MKSKLRELRLGRGLNQRQLSEESHTPQSIVSALERGVLKPWLNVAERLSDALGIPIEDLFPEDKDELLHAAKKR